MTSPKDISRNVLNENVSLRQVMERLNEGVGGVVFLVNKDGVMSGLATDGDVRRAILGGSDLDTSVDRIMQRSFSWGLISDDRTKSLARLSERIRHLPLLDETGRPVDMLAWSNLWRMPLVKPSLGGNESKYVSDCLSSGWVSSQGSYIAKFEAAFSDYMGGGLARCTSSGTTALHLALLGLGIGPGDEVIVPNLTFAATANAVIHSGAEPVFVDVDAQTWTLNPAQIEKAATARTKAVIPVHLYGQPCNMFEIMRICNRLGLKVIEDCAEALGAEIDGSKVGAYGDVSCFSFYANKVITTGEGGLVLCKDEEIFKRISIYRDHGMSTKRRYWHDHVGYNYRMTNVQAAIGLAQLEQVERFLECREHLHQRYSYRLGKVDGIIHQKRLPRAQSICWLYTILIDTDILGLDLPTLSARLYESGIETRHIFYPLHDQPAFARYRSLETPNSIRIGHSGLSLPTSNEMTISDVDAVCDAFLSVAGTSQAVQELNAG